jgi:hypothetical protein
MPAVCRVDPGQAGLSVQDIIEDLGDIARSGQ